MDFLKAYKERIEDIPTYINDYEFYLFDEFVKEFVYKVIYEYFEEGNKRKIIEIPISEVWDFASRNGKYIEIDDNGKFKTRKIEEVSQALLDDIRSVLGFKAENGHLIINPKDLINSYYDYLYACHDIPDNIDDYAFYLFDEFVKEFVSILIKSYDQNMEDNQIISFPLIQIWRIFNLKGYKGIENTKPIILKDMQNFGFKIEGSYNGYIFIDLATLKQAYQDYILIDESKLIDLGYKPKRKKDLIQDYFKQLSKRKTISNVVKASPIPEVTPTLVEESSMSQDNYLNFLKTYFGSDEEDIPKEQEKETVSPEVNDINEVFKSEIVSKALNEMINFCTTNNLEKIAIDYSVFDNYVIYNGLRINNVNASEFTTLIASIPCKMLERRGNTIKIEYNLEELLDFYYEEINKITR